MSSKEQLLTELWWEIQDCFKCSIRHELLDRPTFDTFGNKDSKIVLVGEAAGQEEVKEGKPFIGKAGKVLTSSLEKINVKREEVYISNIVRCNPREKNRNRPPTKEEINNCLPYLLKELEIINPDIVVLMGNTCIKALVDNPELISELRGQFRFNEKLDRLTYFLYHPASTLYKKELETIFQKDLERILFKD